MKTSRGGASSLREAGAALNAFYGIRFVLRPVRKEGSLSPLQMHSHPCKVTPWVGFEPGLTPGRLAPGTLLLTPCHVASHSLM